ncbi:DUF4870 domain-containing protein [Rathayibacter sp. ZW T2_19]|uniref:DUF4870 domain-containing protein n=1 Tax=Rathayibacter rubneri TaxID=2950106 RepID=A0A9X2ISP4_9MICO|nr:DUF4870 domain-containing protein [Rathayibacter rubneri]MCM6762911.1 DUF4870 domain-containing protein [Rathayibacter rubneri]
MSSPHPDHRPQPGRTEQPEQQAQPVQSAPPTGAMPYALGFLALTGLPFLSMLVAGIVMAAVHSSSRARGGVAAENGRRAANWGLTVILVTVLTLVGHFVLLFALTADAPSTSFYPIGIPITLFGVLCVVHLVVIICGLVTANRGRVLRNPLAIPFLRRRAV